MKTDPNDSAYPIVENTLNNRFGLTKREKMAAMNFASGLDFNVAEDLLNEDLLRRARNCCRGADALIAALNEEAK